ncbi:MAG: 23S rRNA (uracil(1939)-C(5))-methyltransferase RlmD [Oscillospiraceae bacterium]|nr:23S rRNA (uracil(1939)-C(5))-methyltransferase RlmD [Oscillospiraceae bacterium]
MALKKNEEIRVKIQSISSEGSGVARFDGQAVFVANTAVGDDIIAHIIKAKPKYAVGIIKKIIKPSKDRIECDCGVFPRCGGCAYRHISYESELEEKKRRVQDAFDRIGKLNIGIDETVGAEKTDRYRNKAQYPVGLSQNGDLVIGFYSPRSHRICDGTDCRLQPEEFGSLLRRIKMWVLTSRVSIYDEQSGKGLLRHIYIRKAEATGEIMVCLVVTSAGVPNRERLVEGLLEENKNIKTVLLNVNAKKTNTVLGDECVCLYGDGYITDVLCGKKIRISPLSFYQVNRSQAQKLYEKARKYADLTGSETLLDLYCGAGTIGLSMSDGVRRLIGVEVVPQAIEDAKINAELNGVKNVRFICDDAKGAAKTLLQEGISPDVIVLDPPRKGCDREVVETVAGMKPERVVYVSCDPATLARDCAVFSQLGYEVKKAAVFDLFPRTVHVETVVLLSRADI